MTLIFYAEGNFLAKMHSFSQGPKFPAINLTICIKANDVAHTHTERIQTKVIAYKQANMATVQQNSRNSKRKAAKKSQQ